MKKPSLPFLRAVADRQKPRIQPPESLNDAQKVIWRQAVDNLPADWFAVEQTPMLVAYCQHVARAAQIEVALSTLDPLASLDVFDKLAKLAALESAKIAMHARSMRLTQQSRLKAETASSRGLGAASAGRMTDPANKFFDDLIAR